MISQNHPLWIAPIRLMTLNGERETMLILKFVFDYLMLVCWGLTEFKTLFFVFLFALLVCDAAAATTTFRHNSWYLILFSPETKPFITTKKKKFSVKHHSAENVCCTHIFDVFFRLSSWFGLEKAFHKLFIPVSNDSVSFSCIAADNSKIIPKNILLIF